MHLAPTTLRLGLLAALIAVLMTGEGVGQEIHGYGQYPNSFEAVFVNQDGTLAITGNKGERNDGRMWLMVMTAQGEVRIDRQVGGVEQGSFGHDIIEVEGGGWLIGGDSRHTNATSSFTAAKTNENGETIWVNSYDPDDDECNRNAINDVIELKNGDFILAGYAGNLNRVPDGGDGVPTCQGWMVRVNRDGDLIWSSAFHGNRRGEYMGRCTIRSILQSEDLILGCGKVQGRGAWLFGVSIANGELQWEQFVDYNPEEDDPLFEKGNYSKIVSVDGEYFAFGEIEGRYDDNHQAFMAKYHSDGRILSYRNLELSFIERDINPFYPFGIFTAKANSSGGFTLSVYGSFFVEDHNHGFLSGIARLDEYGNTIWEDTLRHSWLHAVCVSDEIGILAVGEMTNSREPSNAILYKLSDHSAPFFRRGGHDGEEDFNREDSLDREQQGRGCDLTVLQGDVVRFWVEAHDRQDDQIAYSWTLDDQVISDSTAVTIPFDDLGRFNVICRITDDSVTVDSLWWRVNVVEFYIRSHQPPETSLRLARGEGVDFSLDVRAIEGRELNYKWKLDSAIVSNEAAFALDPFNDFTPRTLTATVSNGNAADSVVWTAQLRSLYRSWQPEGDLLSVEAGSTVRFSVALEEGLPEGARAYWIVRGDTIAVDTLSAEVTFPEVGETWVRSAVMAGEVVLEDLLWMVNVTPLGVGDEEAGRVQRPVLLRVTPNPFNSATTIEYSLVRPGRYTVDVVDISGRLVERLAGGDGQAGSYKAVWNAGSASAGVYIVKVEGGGEREVKKVVLVR